MRTELPAHAPHFPPASIEICDTDEVSSKLTKRGGGQVRHSVATGEGGLTGKTWVFHRPHLAGSSSSIDIDAVQAAPGIAWNTT